MAYGRRFSCLLLALLLLPLAPACGGGGGGDAAPSLGTVAVRNETDQGMAPLVVTQFFLVPVGDPGPGPNLLGQALDPGGVEIVGLFPEGLYNAVAVLASGANVTFVDRQVTAGQPTTFVVPGN